MVKVIQEPDEFGPPLEPCAICYERTKFWYEPKDVAVCKKCAEVVTPDQIPSKERWCAAVDQLISFDSSSPVGLDSAHPTPVH